MAQLRIPGHHNCLFDIFDVRSVFRHLPPGKLYKSLGMRESRRDAEYKRTVILLTQLKRGLHILLSLRAVGRLQNRQLCRAGHHAGVLLILGAVQSRVIRHNDDHAPVDTHVGNRIRRVGRHIEPDMLHTGHGTDA